MIPLLAPVKKKIKSKMTIFQPAKSAYGKKIFPLNFPIIFIYLPDIHSVLLATGIKQNSNVKRFFIRNIVLK